MMIATETLASLEKRIVDGTWNDWW